MGQFLPSTLIKHFFKLDFNYLNTRTDYEKDYDIIFVSFFSTSS